MDRVIHKEMSNNETESAQQQTVELQPLLSSQKQHVEDEEVTIKIKEIIERCGDGVLLQECCIYRVPPTLRYLKEEAYTPKLVSIGPLHYGTNKRLQEMEMHKHILFKRFTQRARSSLEDLVGLVKDLEPKVRASYSETFNLEHEFVKLILTDAGFIIELFFMYYDKSPKIRKDAKFSQSWLRNSISEDLVLLENQLPFFVIEELFNKAFPQNHDGASHPSFLELAYGYFEYYNTHKLKPDSDVKIKHFTDLLRLFYLQGNISEQPRSPFDFGSHRLFYNATALHEVGIKLKGIKNKCLLDLEFSGHTLEIPQIVVEDNTELMFRNMIALEQCHYPDASYISDYALVFDCLIDTDKDVDLLVHKEIISNCLGDPNRVALLLNGLPANFVGLNLNAKYLDMTQRLNGYCQDRRHKMMATLRRDYCNTPWRTVASIAGIILIILTFVQTIFSIIQDVLK